MSFNDLNCEKRYKLVLLGEASVGKTSIIKRFTTNDFDFNSQSTIGASFSTTEIQIDGKFLFFEIWDTAGQELYDSLMPLYYRGANVAMIVYDISNRDSFERMRRLHHDVNIACGNQTVYMILGNKKDLESQRVISYEEGKKFADSSECLFNEC